MNAQPMTTNDENLRRKIRRNAVLLGLVALRFFAGFMLLTALRG